MIIRPKSVRASQNGIEKFMESAQWARLFQENAEKTRKLLAGLPSNRDLISQIKEVGLPSGKVA